MTSFSFQHSASEWISTVVARKKVTLNSNIVSKQAEGLLTTLPYFVIFMIDLALMYTILVAQITKQQ